MLISSSVYGRAWARARAKTFTPEVAASALAKRPDNLRHAAVHLAQAAWNHPLRRVGWAQRGRLAEVYAKCLDGGEHAVRERVQRFLSN